MKDKDAKNSFIYMFVIMGLIALIFFLLIQFNEGELDPLDLSEANRSYSDPPEQVIEEGVDYSAVFKTNFGDIEVDLLEENAPVTVNNFVFLARDDYYDGVKFHRIVEGFVIQGGSRLSLDNNPENDGVGGPGYSFADEINWDDLDLSQEQREQLIAAGFESDSSVTSVPLAEYTLAMANSGPNTNGSQFFFVTAPASDPAIANLQGRHTVFGRVISGQEVVDEIEAVEVDDENAIAPRPVTDVVIEEIEIRENNS